MTREQAYKLSQEIVQITEQIALHEKSASDCRKRRDTELARLVEAVPEGPLGGKEGPKDEPGTYTELTKEEYQNLCKTGNFAPLKRYPG